MANKGQDITGSVIDLAVLKRVLGLSKPHRLLFYSALALAIFLAFLGPMRAYLVQDAIDNYILPKNQEGLLTMFLLLIGVLVTEAVFRFAFTYSSKVLGQSVVKDLRDRVFGHVMRLRLTYFDTTPIGTSTTRTVNDTETISDIFANGILLFFAIAVHFCPAFTVISLANSRTNSANSGSSGFTSGPSTAAFKLSASKLNGTERSFK